MECPEDSIERPSFNGWDKTKTKSSVTFRFEKMGLARRLSRPRCLPPRDTGSVLETHVVGGENGSQVLLTPHTCCARHLCRYPHGHTVTAGTPYCFSAVLMPHCGAQWLPPSPCDPSTRLRPLWTSTGSSGHTGSAGVMAAHGRCHLNSLGAWATADCPPLEVTFGRGLDL